MRLGESGVLALVLAAGAAFPASAAGPVAVNFDDIDASQADISIVSPYQGLGWGDITAYTAVPGFDGFNNGIVSGPNGPNGAYGGGELSGSTVVPLISKITALAGQSFDFLGASFGAGYYNSLSLTITGSFQGAVIGTRTLTLSTTGAVGFAFAFAELDVLTFTASRTASSTDPFACGVSDCTQFTMDDASFVINDLPVTSPTPEPGIVTLLAAGLGVIALRRLPARRRPPRDA